MSLRDVERAMIVFKYFYEKVTDFKQADKPQQIQPIVNVCTCNIFHTFH